MADNNVIFILHGLYNCCNLCIVQYDSNCISRDHEGLHIFTPRNQPKRKLKLPSKRNGCIGWVHIRRLKANLHVKFPVFIYLFIY